LGQAISASASREQVCEKDYAAEHKFRSGWQSAGKKAVDPG
jgi:hypothetical protein